MKTYICLLAVTIAASSACDDGARLTIPTSPVPTPSSPTLYTLSGMVTEMTPSGPAPLEGAVVQFVGSPIAMTTGGDGSYTLSLSSTSRSPAMGASKPGYTSTYTNVVPGDTRRDFLLSRIAANNTLSGQVFETTATGRVPIEGVQVYCDGCGSPVGHTFERTDANGQYRFEWTPNGAMPLLVDKAGYALANQPVGSMPGLIVPTVNGDTRFDIELVRR
jgi:hypothetical protein